MFDLGSVSENSKIRYILEVDLKYCKELHNSHNDYDNDSHYPLCPEKVEVSYDILSKYCKDIVDWYDIKIPDLSDKVNYVIHYKNLIYYLSLGMKLVKIHRTLKFK